MSSVDSIGDDGMDEPDEQLLSVASGRTRRRVTAPSKWADDDESSNPHPSKKLKPAPIAVGQMRRSRISFVTYTNQLNTMC